MTDAPERPRARVLSLLAALPAPAAPPADVRRRHELRARARARSRPTTSPRCCRRSSTLRRRDARHRPRALRGRPPRTCAGRCRSDVRVRHRRPGAIAVSDYDAGVKGYHVALAGCVACSNRSPSAEGRGAAPVTLKVPDKDADSLIKAVASLAQHVRLRQPRRPPAGLDAERPFLRAEFLFQPQIVGDGWTLRRQPRRGAEAGRRARLQPLHGHVLVSKPPSTGIVDAPPGEREPAAGTPARRRPEVPPDDLPAQLTRRLPTRWRRFAARCSPATSTSVAGDAGAHLRRRRQRHRAVGRGRPRVRGNADGPLRADAAKDARFPPFRNEQQKFTYPFFLRAEGAESLPANHPLSAEGWAPPRTTGRGGRPSPRSTPGPEVSPRSKAAPSGAWTRSLTLALGLRQTEW